MFGICIGENKFTETMWNRKFFCCLLKLLSFAESSHQDFTVCVYRSFALKFKASKWFLFKVLNFQAINSFLTKAFRDWTLLFVFPRVCVPWQIMEKVCYFSSSSCNNLSFLQSITGSLCRTKCFAVGTFEHIALYSFMCYRSQTEVALTWWWLHGNSVFSFSLRNAFCLQFRNPKASLHSRLSDLIDYLQKKGDRPCQEFYRALQINAEQLYNNLPSRKILSKLQGQHFSLCCATPSLEWPSFGHALCTYCPHEVFPNCWLAVFSIIPSRVTLYLICGTFLVIQCNRGHSPMPYVALFHSADSFVSNIDIGAPTSTPFWHDSTLAYATHSVSPIARQGAACVPAKLS